MRRLRVLASATAVLLAPTALSSQQFTKPGKITALGAPVTMDTTGMFQAAYAKVGDDMFIGGQPTEKALREMKAQGVTMVVNLRMPDEMARIPIDEAKIIADLGMKYVNIPVRAGTANPYSPDALAKFADAMKGAKGKVLLHCTIAWRASHMWAAYLIQERGVPEEDALNYARAINLMDEHRMGPDGKQPVEEFLGRTLTKVKRPAPPQ
jgi:uncharacterized protein (TIGR01244 family)